MLSRLVSVSESFHDFFLVIDGLNECQDDDDERKFTFCVFAQMSNSKSYILATSGLEADIEEAFSGTTRMAMDAEAMRHDIMVHIDYRLDYGEKLKNLRPELKREIKEKLLEKCDGM